MIDSVTSFIQATGRSKKMKMQDIRLTEPEIEAQGAVLKQVYSITSPKESIIVGAFVQRMCLDFFRDLSYQNLAVLMNKLRNTVRVLYLAKKWIGYQEDLNLPRPDYGDIEEVLLNLRNHAEEVLKLDPDVLKSDEYKALQAALLADERVFGKIVETARKHNAIGAKVRWAMHTLRHVEDADHATMHCARKILRMKVSNRPRSDDGEMLASHLHNHFGISRKHTDIHIPAHFVTEHLAY